MFQQNRLRSLDLVVLDGRIIVLAHLEGENTILFLFVTLGFCLQALVQPKHIQFLWFTLFIVFQNFCDLSIFITYHFKKVVAAGHTGHERGSSLLGSAKYVSKGFAGFKQDPKRQRVLDECRNCDQLTHFGHQLTYLRKQGFSSAFKFLKLLLKLFLLIKSFDLLIQLLKHRTNRIINRILYLPIKFRIQLFLLIHLILETLDLGSSIIKLGLQYSIHFW